MPIVKSALTTNEGCQAFDWLHELSQLLEAVVHPDVLAQIIQVLRIETRSTKL